MNENVEKIRAIGFCLTLSSNTLSNSMHWKARVTRGVFHHAIYKLTHHAFSFALHSSFVFSQLLPPNNKHLTAKGIFRTFLPQFSSDPFDACISFYLFLHRLFFPPNSLLDLHFPLVSLIVTFHCILFACKRKQRTRSSRTISLCFFVFFNFRMFNC